MSNVHELVFLKEKIQELKNQGVYRRLPVLESPSEAEIMLNGKKMINLSSNNYLGFANHPRLKKASIEAIEKYGAGAGADHVPTSHRRAAGSRAHVPLWTANPPLRFRALHTLLSSF